MDRSRRGSGQVKERQRSGQGKAVTGQLKAVSKLRKCSKKVN